LNSTRPATRLPRSQIAITFFLLLSPTLHSIASCITACGSRIVTNLQKLARCTFCDAHPTKPSSVAFSYWAVLHPGCDLQHTIPQLHENLKKLSRSSLTSHAQTCCCHRLLVHPRICTIPVGLATCMHARRRVADRAVRFKIRAWR
jgi:hypothetical protein